MKGSDFMCEKNSPVSVMGKVSSDEQTPVFAIGRVFSNERMKYWGEECFKLSIDITDTALFIKTVVAGQFFMLRSKDSKYLTGRPISAYGDISDGFYDETRHSPFNSSIVSVRRMHCCLIDFLIMRKNGATKELTELKEGDEVEIIGPLGNGFPLPAPTERVCLISGGVGVAPMASLANSLMDATYYFFYACFKRCSYGLDDIPRTRLRIATEDGSRGIKGMLPDILGVEDIKAYDVVYACGPAPMLKYVQSICNEAGVRSYFSMEDRMACGMGACLGCTIRTTEGNKRCCKDGPVFPGEILIFKDEPAVEVLSGEAHESDPDLSVEIAGVKFKNPVIAASGTFGYGVEYRHFVNPELLGGICSKGLTRRPRDGNNGVRIYELPNGGIMNSIGLENPGVRHFIEHELPQMLELDTVLIVNLSGSSCGEYTTGAKLLKYSDIDMVELNISCPNVQDGGMAFGMIPEKAAKVTKAVRRSIEKPLIVKLTPNAPDLVGVALAVKEAGADAISLVNTFQALVIDIDTGKPIFDNVYAGYSGPGIKPIALRMVYDVAKAIRATDPEYPIIGLGGITTWQDAVEFIMAGATAIQVGSATFGNPSTMINIVAGLHEYMAERGFKSLSEFRGTIL